MKKQIIKMILLSLLVIFSFFSWKAVNDVIAIPGASDWVLPIIWASVFFLVWYLSIILIEEKYILITATLFCFLLSLFFVFTFWHALIIFLSFFISIVGIWEIKKDLKLNIKVNAGKSITAGKRFLILAIAIAISSHYYFSVYEREVQEIIPFSKNSQIMGKITSQVLGYVYPEFKSISNEDISVDQFLLQIQKEQMKDFNGDLSKNSLIEEAISNQLGDSATEKQKEEIKKETLEKLESTNSEILKANEMIMLEESRKQLSQMVGKDLSGEERMGDIFSEMLNRRLTAFFQKDNVSSGNISFLPLFLALILFLTLIPLGSLLNIFWILALKLVFFIFIKSGLVTISKIPAEVEIIE